MKKMLAGVLAALLALAPTAALADKGGHDRGHHRGHGKKNPLAFVPVKDLAGNRIGTATIHGFMKTGPRAITAVGVFSGTARDANGNTMELPAEPFTAPLVLPPVPGGIGILQTGPAEPGVCDILFLEIGPINLNLLGLVLDTQPIVIDLDAQPGPGNLLGNLLCGIVGLLDPLAIIGVIDQLVTLLNQLVALLQ